MKKSLVLTLAISALICSVSHGVEFKKDVATKIPVILVNTTDGYTPTTGATSPTVYYLQQNGTQQSLGSPAFTEINATNMPGLYTLNVTADMTNTTGQLVIYVTKAGSRTYRCLGDVVGNLEADTYTLLGTVNTTVTSANTTIGSANTTIGQCNATANTINNTWTSTKAGYLDVAVSSRSNITVNDIWGNATRTITGGNISGASAGDYGEIGTDVWATGTRTLTAGTNIALAKGSGITGFNDIAAADVWSVATRQLTGTQTFNVTGNITGNLSGSVGSLTTWDKTGYALSAAGIDSIWDEVQSGHAVAGSFGKYLDAQVSTVGGGSLTAGDIWNYTISGYSTAGMAGTYLKGAGAAGDPWSADVSTGYTGQAGELLRNIEEYTDYEKHDGDYKGVSKGIRSNR